VQPHGAVNTSRGISPDGYWQRQGGFRFMAAAGRGAIARVRVIAEGAETAIGLAREGNQLRVEIDGTPPMSVAAQWLSSYRLRLTPRNGAPSEFLLSRNGDMTVVNHRGTRWELGVLSEVDALARVEGQAGSSGSEVLAELPGAVTAINVVAGDSVQVGDVLVVMESMKLIFPLTAPRNGVVAIVRCATGDIVGRGQTLIQLEPLASVDSQPA
jgi:3-methylcrotonyl-CoA carboxylase alpha subunit